MTREEHLRFCKICKNQKFDPKQGVVCGLTNTRADFEGSCNFFIEDSELKAQQDIELKENETFEKIASKGKRFANYILDSIFFLIISYIVGVILGIMFLLLSPESFYIFEEGNILFNYLFGFILSMMYYTTLEALTGRTIAKYITRTKVVKENGEKPDFRTIVIRSLCRFIPFEAFSFLGSESYGWHDSISHTIVIDN